MLIAFLIYNVQEALGGRWGLGDSPEPGIEEFRKVIGLFAIVQGSSLLWSYFMGLIADRLNRLTALGLALSIAAVGYTGVGLLDDPFAAIAIPVAIVTFFALGLVAWVGYTIATIQVETDPGPEILATDETAPQLFRTDENGERQYLSVSEAAQTLAETQAKVDDLCN